MEAIQDKMEDLHRRLLTDPSPHVFIAYILREAGLCKMRCPVCHHRWAVLYVSDGQYGEWRLLPTKYDFHCPSCHNLGVAKGFTRFPEEKPKPSFPEWLGTKLVPHMVQYALSLDRAEQGVRYKT